MAELILWVQRFLGSPLGTALAVSLAVLFTGALLWKILRSEEGFLFGYGDWVVGKWQAGRDKEVEQSAHGPPQGGGHPELRKRWKLRERELQVAGDVLLLSRMLDGDLAYHLNHPLDWGAQVTRNLQTLVSGVPKVIRPGCRCRCGFFVPDRERGELVLAVGEGYSNRPRLSLERSCAGRAFLTGEEYYCRDIVTDPLYWHSSVGKRDYRSIACVPVRAGRTVFGVICMDAERVDAFTPADFAHLETFAAKAAVICSIDAWQQQMASCPDAGREGEEPQNSPGSGNHNAVPSAET